MASCQKEQPEVLSLATRSQAGLAKGGYTFIEVNAPGGWNLSIDFKGGQEWATLTQTSGTGEHNGLVMTYDPNESDEQRSLELILTGERSTVSCTFVQMTAFSHFEVKSDPVGAWMELPKMDNPEVPIDSINENGDIITYKVQKLYFVNIVFQLQHDKDTEYHHFRISMTRNGVVDITEI